MSFIIILIQPLFSALIGKMNSIHLCVCECVCSMCVWTTKIVHPILFCCCCCYFIPLYVTAIFSLSIYQTECICCVNAKRKEDVRDTFIHLVYMCSIDWTERDGWREWTSEGGSSGGGGTSEHKNKNNRWKPLKHTRVMSALIRGKKLNSNVRAVYAVSR